MSKEKKESGRLDFEKTNQTNMKRISIIEKTMGKEITSCQAGCLILFPKNKGMKAKHANNMLFCISSNSIVLKLE